MVIAIYARYSDDIQNPKSADDQIKLCRRYVESHYDRASVVLPFKDEAFTGKLMMNRPGLQSLLGIVRESRVRTVVFESLDRLSRNSGDVHKLYEIMSHYKADMVSVNEGTVNELLVGFKGTMNAMYIKDMVEKVKRGQMERAREGRHPASKAYGYKVKGDAVDEKGRHVNGLREIVEKEAKVVRRIFEMYVAGHTVREIAKTLNAEGIPSPSGKEWTYNSIRGVEGRGTGILANNSYRGKLTYNKTQKVVDPETGKSRYVIRPRSEWIVTDIPEHKIVSDHLWHEAEKKRLSSSKEERRKYKERKAKKKIENVGIDGNSSKRPLTGLVFCGACGEQSILRDRERYVCRAWKNYRTCGNSRGMQSKKLLEETFRVLEKHVFEHDWYETFLKVWSVDRETHDDIKAHIEKIDGQIEAVMLVIDRGINLEQVVGKLESLQIERTEWKAKLHAHTPDFPASNEYIQVVFLSELQKMKERCHTPNQVAMWRKSLSLVVEKLVTTPIKNQDKGMTIDVKIAPMEGWEEFYRRVTSQNTKTHRRSY